MAKKREEEEPSKAANQKKKKQRSRSGVDEGFVSMNNQLASMGLTLREVPGDGNCLFRALGDQLEGHMRNHLKHRQDVVQFMRDHRDDFEPFVEDDVPFEKHVANLSQAGTYAGNDAIVAFARLHASTVVIHQLNAPLWQIHGLLDLPAAKGVSCQPHPPSLHPHPQRELHIAYHNGDHYNSIRKLGDSNETPANIKLLPIAANAGVGQSPSKSGSKSSSKEVCGSAMREEMEALEREVMEQTGSENQHLVRQALMASDYSPEHAAEVVALMESATADCSLWGPNGSGTRIFGQEMAAKMAGAKPKMTNVLQERTLRRMQQQQLSNRQKKELKKRESKERRRLQGHVDSHINLDQSTSSSSDEDMTVMVKNVECLSI